ncbi:MAG: DUF4232 domain-containing protein [Actinomycetota bacterium]|jgi:hypothetical protein|nr:DUF4232 domain-containing protein [Actinomycetota bacterium]
MHDLHLGVTWAGAPAQAESYRVVMTNVSNHACKVEGAPSVSLLGQGSASLATHVGMTPSQAASWAKGLRIAPSAPSSFTVTLNQGGADPQPLPTCPVVTGISVSFSSIGGGTPATLAFPPLPVDTPPLRAYSTHPGYACNQVYMSGVKSGD